MVLRKGKRLPQNLG